MSNQYDIKKQLIDQSAHLLGAMIILAPLFILPSLISALWAGFGIGLVRELSQRGTQVTWQGFKDSFKPFSLLDMTFWSIGGGLIYLLAA